MGKYKLDPVIYKIINIKNNKFYIGSAKHFPSRKRIHLHQLRKNKHHNTYLQNSYNKYGEENFQFEILEKCLIEDLVKKEQYYLDFLKPQYNICKKAYSNLGIIVSKETKEKQRQAKLGVFRTKKIILQYDLNHNLVKKWYNGRDHIPGFNKSGVSMCLIGKLKTYKKFIWKYA